jgi:hypothetical protein
MSTVNDKLTLTRAVLDGGSEERVISIAKSRRSKRG